MQSEEITFQDMHHYFQNVKEEAKTQWEHDLGKVISVQEWGRINMYNIKI